MTVLLGYSSSSYAAEDSDFDKVQWSYEIFDDGDPGAFNHSISKGILTNRPLNNEALNMPLGNADCVFHPPQMNLNSSLVNRTMTCKEKGNKTFSHATYIECGKPKVKDIATSFVYGKFCETEKKCYQKSHKIIFSCSYR
jgi:hypothetical protein